MTYDEIYKDCLDNNHAAKILVAQGRWVPDLCNYCQKKIDDSIYQARVKRDEQNYKLTTSNYSKTPNPIISHEELLAIIDDNFSQCGDDCESCRRDNASWFALHEVVELHKPIEISGEELCDACEEWTNEGANYRVYPCPTIQAIEKELG